MYLGDEYTRNHTEIQSGPHVLLSISDTGCGMDTETQSRVFEPFFTTKEQARGTGLGLSTVYGIVKQHKGHISVDSTPGRGSTFKIYLPRFHGAVETIREPVIQPTRTRATETVLLVEDDDQLRRLTFEILQGAGYTVLEADSGPEALLLSQHHAGPIHLMLTDIIMPGMNGHILTERLMSSHSGTVVLYMSGYAGAAAGRQGSIGADTSIVMKPFTPEQLLDKVREVLDAAEEGTHGDTYSASSY